MVSDSVVAINPIRLHYHKNRIDRIESSSFVVFKNFSLKSTVSWLIFSKKTYGYCIFHVLFFKEVTTLTDSDRSEMVRIPDQIKLNSKIKFNSRQRK